MCDDTYAADCSTAQQQIHGWKAVPENKNTCTSENTIQFSQFYNTVKTGAHGENKKKSRENTAHFCGILY